MARLIDADTICYNQLLNTGNKEHPLEWAVSRSRIDNMPTIEVVRCKDCKWRGELGRCRNMDSYMWYNRPNDDDFCSWGERKDEIDRCR